MVDCPELTFEAATHTYRLEGKVVPSVTEIISAAGFHGDAATYFDDDSAERGRLVHELIEANLLGISNEPPFTEPPYPELVNYLIAALMFVSDALDTSAPMQTEVRVYHPRDLYAGTIDLHASWKASGLPVIVDWKTGQPHPAHAVQSAAYWQTLGAKERKNTGRICVYLRDDGTYKPAIHGAENLLSDQHAFNAALTVFNWRKRYL